MNFGLDVQIIYDGSIRQRTARAKNDIRIVMDDIVFYRLIRPVLYRYTGFYLANVLGIQIHDTYLVGGFCQHLQYRWLKAYLCNAFDTGIIFA